MGQTNTASRVAAFGAVLQSARAALSVRVLGGALALGVGYAALSKFIAVFTAFGSTTGAAFWPGAGLTLAVLLRRPRAEWPFYLIAVALAEAAGDVSQGFALPLALAWGIANTAEPLMAAWLLTRRPLWKPGVVRRADLGPFVLAAIVVGPMVGALLGTAAGAFIAGDPWLPRLPRWYIGDAVGVLVVAPALLVLRPPPYRLPSARTTVWFALLVSTSLVALGPWTFADDVGLPFLVLPVLIAITLRVGPHGAAAGVLVVAMLVETVTASGRGPFAEQGAFDGLVVAQMFVAMSAVTAYTVAVLTGELVTRERLEGTLRAQALRDSLTGLANRRLLFDRLEHASRRLARRPGLVALLFIDLDRFKSVNDIHGHIGGDDVLMEAADRLRAIVRDNDSVARLGGDEFLILAEDLSDVDGGLALAARVVAAFEEPFRLPDGPVRVDASVGIAVTSKPIKDPEAFLSRADSAMYEAKRAGGGRVALESQGAAASAHSHAEGTPYPIGDRPLQNAGTTGRLIHVEEDTFGRQDGTPLPVADSAAPVTLSDGAGLAVAFRDDSAAQAERQVLRAQAHHVVWFERIREALDEDRLVLYGQPIVDLATGAAVQHELLLRMISSSGEVIAPGVFLPTAEKFGLIGEIDRWVISEAVALAATGRRLAVNLSAESVGRIEVLQHIEHELERTEAPAENLCFEVTETALMEDVDAGRRFADRLATRGCSFALDDFGTGYGSLTYLRHLPISEVKIDIQFVRDMANSKADQKLVQAIVHIAKSLGKTTVAEGVEDQQTLDLLRDYGVDFAQGYYVGRPAPFAMGAWEPGEASPHAERQDRATPAGAAWPVAVALEVTEATRDEAAGRRDAAADSRDIAADARDETTESREDALLAAEESTLQALLAASKEARSRAAADRARSHGDRQRAAAERERASEHVPESFAPGSAETARLRDVAADARDADADARDRAAGREEDALLDAEESSGATSQAVAASSQDVRDQSGEDRSAAATDRKESADDRERVSRDVA